MCSSVDERCTRVDCDLEPCEYESYIRVLENRIVELTKSQDDIGVFDTIRKMFVTKVKLPESLFVKTGLLKFVVDAVSCPEAAEKVCLLLAQMIYLTDSLTEFIEPDFIVELARYAFGGERRHLNGVILLNNVLVERREQIGGLISCVRPFLEGFGNIELSEFDLHLLMTFEPVVAEDRELFVRFSVNAMALMGRVFHVRSQILTLHLLLMCCRDGIGFDGTDVLVQLRTFLSSPNTQIIEPVLDIFWVCLKRGAAVPLDGSDVLQIVSNVRNDEGEGIIYRGIKVIRLCTQQTDVVPVHLLLGVAELAMAAEYRIRRSAAAFILDNFIGNFHALSAAHHDAVLAVVFDSIRVNTLLTRKALDCAVYLKAHLVKTKSEAEVKEMMASCGATEFAESCLEMTDLDIAHLATLVFDSNL